MRVIGNQTAWRGPIGKWLRGFVLAVLGVFAVPCCANVSHWLLSGGAGSFDSYTSDATCTALGASAVSAYTGLGYASPFIQPGTCSGDGTNTVGNVVTMNICTSTWGSTCYTLTFTLMEWGPYGGVGSNSVGPGLYQRIDVAGVSGAQPLAVSLDAGTLSAVAGSMAPISGADVLSVFAALFCFVVGLYLFGLAIGKILKMVEGRF